MSKWTDSLEEKGTREAEERVFSAVGAILEKKAERASGANAGRRSWWLNWQLPAAGMAASALVLAFWLYPRGSSLPIEEIAAEDQGMDFEIAMDLRLIRDLREVEKLELLQKLGDPEEWHKEKKIPRKS